MSSAFLLPSTAWQSAGPAIRFWICRGLLRGTWAVYQTTAHEHRFSVVIGLVICLFSLSGFVLPAYRSFLNNRVSISEIAMSILRLCPPHFSLLPAMSSLINRFQWRGLLGRVKAHAKAQRRAWLHLPLRPLV